MHEHAISFLHLSDTHFGVHYAVNPKNPQRRAYGELFFQKVEEVIDTAISKHQVDFILHTGDFFNRSSPPPAVVGRALKPFLLAATQEIPVYLLPGNHERSKLPLGLFSYYDNINLFDTPSSFCFEKNGLRIKITGFPHIRHNAKAQFEAIVRQAWNNCNSKTLTKPHYSILLAHQLIEGSCIENYTFRRGHNVVAFQQIPTRFNYLACGHVHRFQFLYRPSGLIGGSSLVCSTNKQYSIRQEGVKQLWQFSDYQASPSLSFQGPVIAYSGSLERVSLVERNEPKGYITGKLCLSEQDHKMQTVEYSFHPLSAIEMGSYVWDLSRASVQDYVAQTVEELHSIPNLSHQNGEEGILSAVFRIRIKGTRDYSLKWSKHLDFLKQEAKRLNVYLTFSYDSIPA